jgi:1-pyrroline-5-carboxylate dehydrogenase
MNIFSFFTMQKFVKQAIQRPNLLPKPSNLIPRFQYNELPNDHIQSMVNQKLETTVNIPTVIDGREYFSGEFSHVSPSNFKHTSPLDKSKQLYEAHVSADHFMHEKLNDPSFDLARKHWNELSLESRINIFEIVADRIASNFNGVQDELLTDTMVGQGKSLYEAEIDSVCELVDFLKFNNYYASQINNRQLISDDSEYNFTETNGLNGFAMAITPFNFTAISANLVSVPLLMGTPVIWKPSEYAMLSNYTYFKLLLECNIPPELISFTPMHPEDFMDTVGEHPTMAGVAFTGSSEVFDDIYKFIGEGISGYFNYPRIVGETGGKNFHFVHESADPKLVGEKTHYAAFGYNGQKCSACSVLYCPSNLWDEVLSEIKSKIQENDELQYQVNGLIHKKSYDKTNTLLEYVKNDPELEIVHGGNCDDSSYYHVEPTIVKSDNLHHYMFWDEFFAPILTVHVYDPEDYEYVLERCIENDEYNLTGAIFGQDEKFLNDAFEQLRFNAGNFYINDMCTGAVVGRQPFGGFGKSGTNDKAGDINLLYRFCNQRSVNVNPN